MARKDNMQKLEELRLKRSQLNARIKEIEALEKQKQRKADAHRKIQMGAIVSKYLDCNGITIDEFIQLVEKIVANPDVVRIIKERKQAEIDAMKDYDFDDEVADSESED